MLNLWEIEKELSKFKEALFIGVLSKNMKVVNNRLKDLKDEDFIKLLKEIDNQQGITINKLMVEGVDEINLKPLGSFKSKPSDKEKRVTRIQKNIKRRELANQSVNNEN